MTSRAHRVQYTYEEYVALERSSNVKHEYLEGQIYGFAGGSPEHAALASAFVGLLFPRLAGSRCRSFSSDLRIRIRATGLATYPDVTVICGRAETDPEDDHAITNPTLSVEVLSQSTEQYERADKFEHYKHLESLQQYVLVAQERRQIDLWSREEDGAWSCCTAHDGETLELESIAARFEVGTLYDAAAEPPS